MRRAWRLGMPLRNFLLPAISKQDIFISVQLIDHRLGNCNCDGDRRARLKAGDPGRYLFIQENACNLTWVIRNSIGHPRSRADTNNLGGSAVISVRFVGAALAGVLAVMPVAIAQDEATEKAIERYRQMLREDPWSNPALLDADRGETLWTTARGPNKVSLEQCDLGKGPGVVEGAFAALPRYFADADRVMDVETRILWCMEKLQGFNQSDLTDRVFPGGGQPVKEIGAIATYVASKSAGMKFAPGTQHVKEKDMIALGETLFNRRSGPFDFACTTCHSAEGTRIRLQGLPYLSNPAEARKVVGEWPAYRVSSTHVMTMQHRLYDCYWQMRMPQLELGSDAAVALVAYLVKTAEGGEVAAPGLKR